MKAHIVRFAFNPLQKNELMELAKSSAPLTVIRINLQSRKMHDNSLLCGLVLEFLALMLKVGLEPTLKLCLTLQRYFERKTEGTLQISAEPLCEIKIDFYLLTETQRGTESALTERIHRMTARERCDLASHRVWLVAR